MAVKSSTYLWRGEKKVGSRRSEVRRPPHSLPHLGPYSCREYSSSSSNLEVSRAAILRPEAGQLAAALAGGVAAWEAGPAEASAPLQLVRTGTKLRYWSQ